MYKAWKAVSRATLKGSSAAVKALILRSIALRSVLVMLRARGELEGIWREWIR